MTLLQAAREHAEQPDVGFANLKQERTACGIEEPAFDMVVEQSRKEPSGDYRIPDVERVHEQMLRNLNDMIGADKDCVGFIGGWQWPDGRI